LTEESETVIAKLRRAGRRLPADYLDAPKLSVWESQAWHAWCALREVCEGRPVPFTEISAFLDLQGICSGPLRLEYVDIIRRVDRWWFDDARRQAEAARETQDADR
jgi:hypothetical protein